MKFRPGQRVEVVRSECMPTEALEFVGKRGSVVGLDRSLLGLIAQLSDHHTIYHVDMDGGEQLALCEHMLKPIDERGDWNEIERITGYKPPTFAPA